MTDLVERVAARHLRAAFFNVGDIILYGKYKNKKGRIVSFGENDKGQPTVEIEPIPKGRKKNKVMGLFKIWRSTTEKEATMTDPKTLALKVAARYLQAALGLGRTLDHGTVRIHRYRDHLRVTDLTNAGKRGKKVRSFSLQPSYAYKGDDQKWLDNMATQMIRSYKDYQRMLSFVKDVQHDYPTEISIEEYEERGIDVTPAGAKLKVVGVDFEGTAEPKTFLLKRHVQMTHPKTGKPSHWQDTLYYPAGRKDAGKFYAWAKDNLNTIKRMDMMQLRKQWDALGVNYDYH